MTNRQKLSILSIDLGMGGTQRFISLLLPELIKDFEVTLVLFVDYIHFEIHKDVNLVILSTNSTKSNSYLFKIKNALSLYSKYKKIIKSEQIDISLSLLPLPNIINSFLAISNKKVKTIISERCFSSEMYKNNRMQMILAKVCFPLLYHHNNRLFSNSIYINEDLQQNFRVKMPMHVIYNPIDIDARLRIYPDTIKNVNKLKIINSGRIYEAKNQQLILNAMALSEKGVYQLNVLGNGELQEELQSKVENLGLTNFVKLEGKVSNVRKYLIENDCFILSSNNEGFPNALLEALSVGLPCISTNCLSGPLEILNDNESVNIEPGEFFKAKFGILVNINDAIGMNKAMEFLKNNPKQRRHYSNMGFERSKNYSMENIYHQIKKLLIN
jgi:N-acetylgalactosamine-N,N'-diacetylbacillosaminyl-diphospho-undecaprenol 4-alpha-N-acetylgalactosaminyltransferase